ncbi:tRNA modification GTPase MnmE [Clostridia bacterium]|nr:tRNA modification GTPase MnmE [Clostridia bacterium]
MSDTIAQIVTPPYPGAVGIIRLSGDGSVPVVQKIFSNKSFREAESHRAYYGYIMEGGTPIDEVIVLAMLAPRSYTCEDVVEIQSHGNIHLLRRILDVLIAGGARLAEAGEFTKRAFLNGRLDLTQAEAVCDIINAASKSAQTAGLRRLQGHLRGKISNIRQEIIALVAEIEVSIDYPEHEMEQGNIENAKIRAEKILEEIREMTKNADIGRVLQYGIETAIIGKPNVGKSSVLNTILKEERAIVTETAGTTRDTLTELVNIGEVTLRLTDTAGIRETSDCIEKIGVERAVLAAKNADLILWVVDGAQRDADIENVLKDTDAKVIILSNKSDIRTECVGGLSVSAKTGAGFDELYKTINSMFLDNLTDIDVVCDKRHIELLDKTAQALADAINTANLGFGEDFLTQDFVNAYKFLGEIIGAELGDDVCDTIFAKFCVGK